MVTVTMCVYGGKLWLHGWRSLGNVQVQLVLTALVCANRGLTVTNQSSSGILTQTETQKNIKIAVENANLCVKSMGYVHFAEICEKCSNMRNMRQLYIRVKLTGLIMTQLDVTQCMQPSSHTLQAVYKLMQWLH